MVYFQSPLLSYRIIISVPVLVSQKSKNFSNWRTEKSPQYNYKPQRLQHHKMNTSLSTTDKLFYLVQTIMIALLLPPFSKGHSYLTQPQPYGNACARCSACPPHHGLKKLMHHTEDHPQETWRRGEKIEVKWARNNHNGGFVRLSLVPVNKASDERAVERFSFYYGCFERKFYLMAPWSALISKANQGYFINFRASN